MDGWMDGEDLIICLAIWMPNKARLPLTYDDSGAGCIASRNRLRFKSLWERFRKTLERFWDVLRRQNGVQIKLLDFLFDYFLQGLFALSFNGSLKAHNLKFQ